MAKLIIDPCQLRGQIGELVFKHYGQQIVVTKKPDMSGVQRTEAQLAAQARFRQATMEAKRRLADPAWRTEYAARAQEVGKPLFAVAVSDCYQQLKNFSARDR